MLIDTRMIPDDIMVAAREAFRGGVGYPSDTPIADSALVIYIALAILAERQRCAEWWEGGKYLI